MHFSVFQPASSQADALLWLWNVCTWICCFILAVVTVSLVYMMVRFRRRDDREPDQRTGNRKLEIAWTAVPVALVTTLFALSIVTARTVDRPLRAPDVIVIGHQWWWEVRYPGTQAVTANEVHLPSGRELLVEIDTADVIHDFWVPELGRKIDAIPGRHNYIWITAKEPRVYNGACAEFCGPQHAWMRFRAIVQDGAAFSAWLAAEAAPAGAPSSVDAAEGRTRFTQLTCVNCHAIRGVHEQQPYAPDLTHVGSRTMLAGERLRNTPNDMREWLHEPNIVKPNCLMPNLNLSNQDLNALAAYLEGLK